MTILRTLLLVSAAGIVAVATAQAADLPTRKAAPVDYVRVCNVGGITGWTLPGSDTCVKFSGYLTAQFAGGNLNTQYNWANTSILAGLTGVPPLPFAQGLSTQRVLVAASQAQGNTTFYRHETGWSTRANLSFDMASNTAYGPLIGHIDINSEAANGFDALGGTTYLNTGYLTWAGITAGMAQSFFSFTAGGDNWANFLSPDRKGFNEPTLLAYTASFGGGFTATISAESPGPVGGSGGGVQSTGAIGSNPGNITFGGQRWPDIVGALHFKQGWGEAQLSGVLHNVNVSSNAVTSGLVAADSCGVAAIALVNCASQHNQIGWGIDAGVKVNLPQLGDGDNILLTGAYSQSAVWYGGMGGGEMMWGEGGQVNGNGQPMYLADAFFNPLTNQWSKPTAWSLTGLFEHNFTPQFYLDLEGSYGEISWSNMGGGCNFFGLGCGVAQTIQGPLSPRAKTWILGADLGWNPVTNLNFDFEMMYQGTVQDRPSGFLGTVYNLGGVGGAVFVPGDWHGDSNGVAGRLRVTRYF
jgi:hypothetical protein